MPLNLETSGPFNLISERGEIVTSFRWFKHLWFKFTMYGVDRPHDKWRHSGKHSYWRLHTLSFSYGATPQSTQIKIICDLETRPDIGVMRTEGEVPIVLYRVYEFLTKQTETFDKHQTKVFFSDYELKNIPMYQDIGACINLEARVRFDASRLMFRYVRRDRERLK